MSPLATMSEKATSANSWNERRMFLKGFRRIRSPLKDSFVSKRSGRLFGGCGGSLSPKDQALRVQQNQQLFIHRREAVDERARGGLPGLGHRADAPGRDVDHVQHLVYDHAAFALTARGVQRQHDDHGNGRELREL